MMRNALVLLLLPLILLLAACQQGAIHPTLDDTGVPSTQMPSTAETRPMRDLYVSDSMLEQQTQGAVQCYEPDPGIHKVLASFENDLLLVSTNINASHIILTRITGEKGAVKQQVQISCNPEQFVRSLRISFDSLGYYDENNGCIIFLNGQLQETRRVILPSNRVGNPIISSDLSKIYYATETQIRAMDSQTEMSRLLREHSYPTLVLDSVCFNNEQILCHIVEDDEDQYAAFISTKNGAITAVDTQMLSFSGENNSYFLCRREGSIDEYLFGEYGQIVNEFAPKQDGSCFWLPEAGKVVVVRTPSESTVILDAYDLQSGLQTASISLTDVLHCNGMTASVEENVVWFLMQDGTNDRDYLCRWDMSRNSVANTSKYTSAYYTADKPDVDGLANCNQHVSSLADLYSVRITFADSDMVIPQEYSFVAEHKVRAIEKGITKLEDVLSRFPNGFLARLAQSMQDKILHVQLVRSVSDGPLSLQHWENGNSYITLQIGEAMEQDFYHGLFHTMESFLFANSGYLDYWNTYNPKNFNYLYTYTGYESLKDSKYLTDGQRTFIDAYAMTYPKEDRARIFEYAMMEGNESLFATNAMQRKLSILSTTIRDAFDLKQEPKLPWEIYLK